jgi:hypothetical protein
VEIGTRDHGGVDNEFAATAELSLHRGYARAGSGIAAETAITRY